MIEIGRYQQGQWRSRRRPALLAQTETQATAERVADAEATMQTVSGLFRHIVGNLTMLGRCSTEQSRRSAIATISTKADAIGRLMPRLSADLESVPFHLDALRLQELSWRLMEAAVQRVSRDPDDRVFWRDSLDLLAYQMDSEVRRPLALSGEGAA